MTRFHERRRHRHHHRFQVWFTVGTLRVRLNPLEKTEMGSLINLAQIDNLLIQVSDQNNNILPGVVFDAPPAWTNDTPATATLVASADGTTAVVTPVAVGVTNVGLNCLLGGKSFAAALQVTVAAATTPGAPFSVSIIAVPAPLPTA